MPPLSWRPLEPIHLEAVEALHRCAIGALGPGVVKPEASDFFAKILGGGGHMTGVFADERLIAYGVLQHQLPDDDDPRPDLGVPPDRLRVKLAGASVDPHWRGHGLQRALIAARVALAGHLFADRAPLLYATSAPANGPSWTNLLAEGFSIRAIKLYYGGYPRYVLVHDDGPWERSAEMICDPGDLDTQRGLLSQGWRGVAATRAKGARAVLFAAAPGAPPASDRAPFPGVGQP